MANKLRKPGTKKKSPKGPKRKLKRPNRKRY